MTDNSSIKSVAEKKHRLRKNLFSGEEPRNDEFRKRDLAAFEGWEQGRVEVRREGSSSFMVRPAPKLKLEEPLPKTNSDFDFAKSLESFTKFFRQYQKESLITFGVLALMLLLPYLKFDKKTVAVPKEVPVMATVKETAKKPLAVSAKLPEFENWSASYEPTAPKNSDSEVYLPSWVAKLPEAERCAGRNCLPSAVSVSDKVCIETKFSSEPTDVVISQFMGYYGNYQNQNTKILSFDKLTASKYGLVESVIKKGLSWRVVDCPD